MSISATTPLLVLQRLGEVADTMLGILHTPAGPFYTLEPPWLDNVPFHSCIPPGAYHTVVDDYNRADPPYECLHLLEVDGREYIKMHGATWASELWGCIAPQMGLRWRDDGTPQGDGRSRPALREVLNSLGGATDCWVRVLPPGATK